MADEQLLSAYTLAIAAALARDLERANLLSGTSRKVIHDGLADIRNMDDEGGEGTSETSSLRRAALDVLDQIRPAADG